MQLTVSARTKPNDEPLLPLAAIVIAPDALVTVMPVPAVKVVRVKPVPLPMSKAPFAGVVVNPVPPLAIGKVPVTPVVKGNPVALVSVPLDGVPKAPPLTTKEPAVPVFMPNAVTTPVPVVVVAGAAPAPPPITKALAAKAADVAQVVPLLKYGTPPEVPAIVNAGVVVPVATVTMPPVQPTEVTVPEPLLLNVVQSAAVSKPRLVADDEGKLSVITGVVVPVATEDETSVPVVLKVKAATDVTVPEPLLLNVVQSAEVSKPRFVADADGKLSVMTGVVVPVATEDDTSVPVVPKVKADTEVTVPVLFV